MDDALKNAAFYSGAALSLSLIYNITYWWFFDIDVFVFYEYKDFLLNVIYPLRFSGASGVVYVLYFIILILILFYIRKNFTKRKLKSNESVAENSYDNNKNNIYKQYSGCIYMFILAMCCAYMFFIKSPQSKIMAIIFAVNVAGFGFVSAIEFGIKSVNILNLHASDIVIYFVDRLLLFLIIYLPLSAFALAYSDAKAIKVRYRFQYIMASDFTPIKPRSNAEYFVYLGSVGEKFIFTDRKFSENFIIDKSVMPVVQLRNLNMRDGEKSINLFLSLLDEEIVKDSIREISRQVPLQQQDTSKLKAKADTSTSQAKLVKPISPNKKDEILSTPVVKK